MILCISVAKNHLHSSFPNYFLGKCLSPIDIAAVIDVSDNLSPSDLPAIKNFLKKVGSNFHVATYASHMSVILAGAEVRAVIGLSALGASKHKFPPAVDESVKHLGGAWSLDKGLSLVKESVFTVENGARPFIPKVVLIMTNGQQTNGSNDVLQSRAKDLHDMGMQVYVVGVGDGVSRDELGLMVTNESEYLYHVDGFEDLNTLAVNISNDICKRDHIGNNTVYDNFVRVFVV
jgi:hypothetical protein